MAGNYILPFVVYLVGTSLASLRQDVYPLAYAGVCLAGGYVSWRSLQGQGILVPHRKVKAAVVVGIVGIGAWIGLSELQLEAWLTNSWPSWLRPAPRVGYDPRAHFDNPIALWGFVGIRLLGLTVLVPVVEEIFWRGFLARWLVSANWEEVPLGKFTPYSFLGVIFLFVLAHPEWLAAAVYCALVNGLLIWKRDLWNCVVAHSVSNLILGFYVLFTQTWWLW